MPLLLYALSAYTVITLTVTDVIRAVITKFVTEQAVKFAFVTE
jgi:hypothetical protein